MEYPLDHEIVINDDDYRKERSTGYREAAERTEEVLKSYLSILKKLVEDNGLAGQTGDLLLEFAGTAESLLKGGAARNPRPAGRADESIFGRDRPGGSGDLLGRPGAEMEKGPRIPGERQPGRRNQGRKREDEMADDIILKEEKIREAVTALKALEEEAREIKAGLELAGDSCGKAAGRMAEVDREFQAIPRKLGRLVHATAVFLEQAGRELLEADRQAGAAMKGER